LREGGSWCGETHIQKAVFLLGDGRHVPLGREANAARNMALVNRWLPRWFWVSPRTELCDWRVTGARPA
jgi:hypothetical protein